MRDGEQSSFFTWGVSVVVSCVLLSMFEQVIWLVVPALLALVGYYCLQPAVRALVSAGLKHRTAANLVTGLLFLATVAGLMLLLSLSLTRAVAWQERAATYVNKGLELLEHTDRLLAEKLPAFKSLDPLNRSEQGLAAVKKSVGNYLKREFLQLLPWLPSVLLVPYLTFFILHDGNRLKKHLIRGVPNAFFEKTLLLVDRVDRSLQGFLVGLVKLTFLDTMCLGLGLWLLGIHAPFALGLIAAVLAWVPYVGSVAGCVLVTLVAATECAGRNEIVYACIALFLFVRLLDDFVFLPLTVGRSLRFHPVLSVLMLFLGAAVAGPTGLLLALPVLGVVAVITEIIFQIVTDERLRARHRHARRLQWAMTQAP